jgi:S-formylglutathione hydrolase FrmB
MKSVFSHLLRFVFVTSSAFICLQELPQIVLQTLHQPSDKPKFGVFGHSMGGHGALIAHLSKPDLFKVGQVSLIHSF